MNTTVICPHCGKQIEITEAISAEIQKNLLADIDKKHQEEIILVKKDVEEKIKKSLATEMQFDLKDLKKQLEEKDEKVREYRENELKIREEKRKIEEREKELTLEVTRRIDEERKIVLKQAEDEHRLKDMEKEKKLNDMEKLVEELKRKAQQGSQQTQGEVLELDLENTLIRTFPSDTIEPVGKGVRGADVRQIVKSPRGVICGVILWESKRTKSWSEEWLTKLKDDLRSEKANIPVIVTSVMPRDTDAAIAFKENVWICQEAFIIPIAMLLRKSILDVAYQKAVASHKGDKADLLFEYVTGHEFRQQVEALVEVYQEQKNQIDKERAAFERIWKARESQSIRLLHSTASIYGSMQGLAGSSLPQVKGLDLLISPDVGEPSNSLPIFSVKDNPES
jgi:hypothetical protein